MKARLLVIITALLSLVSMASAGTEYVIMAGAVTTKPLLGLLISLGIENFVSAVNAVYLYNMIAVSVLFLIAAFSGPRSETMFCIIVPIFAGLFEWFGWLRMTDATTHLPSQAGQMGLIALTIVVFLLGIFMYMNEQNREKYGVGGPGAKWLNIIVFIALFNVSLGVISGFATFPMGNSSPISNACTVGFSCDGHGNYDFQTTMNGISGSAGASNEVFSALGGFAEAIASMVMIFFGLVASLVTAPIWLANIIGGIYPWFIKDAAGTYTTWYLGFISVFSIMLIFIYLFGIWEFISNRQGSTL